MAKIDKLSDSIDDGNQVIKLLNEAMSKLLKTQAAHALGDPHVREMYSPPRMTSPAYKVGMGRILAVPHRLG